MAGRKRKDPRIECEYYEEIEITNPKTGKVIKQKVKVTRYKPAGEQRSDKLLDDVKLEQTSD